MPSVRRCKPVIIQFLSSCVFSGAESIALEISRALSRKYQFYYLSPNGPIKERCEAYKVSHLTCPKFNFVKLAKVARDLNAHIVHAHDYAASVTAAVAPVSANILSHIHKNAPVASKFSPTSVLFALAAFRFIKVIAVSDSVRNEFYGNRWLTIPWLGINNAVNIDSVRARAKARAEVRFDLLFVGRLTEEKDPLAFIELVDKLKKLGFNEIRAKMIGQGPLENSCSDYISALDLSENIEMLGFSDNPYPYMVAATALVMTSKWEGYGLVAEEALALGTRVFALNVGGIGAIVTKPEFGAVVKSHDELIDVVTRELQSETKNIVKYDSVKFDEFVEQFDNTYQSVLGLT